jgi:glycine dehydrogenase subunit 1
MSDYTPHTGRQIEEMLSEIGICGISELFSFEKTSDGGLSVSKRTQYGAERELKRIAAKNKPYRTVFLGAGAYRHYIPEVVRSITANPRFVTAYTPYQPELSQGLLQAIFEYQSLIARLTGLDASNASQYDGAAAAAEAVSACLEDAPGVKVLISDGVNPRTVEVVSAYLSARDIKPVIIPLKDGATDIEFINNYDASVACVLIQQPNYYGVIEDAKRIGSVAKEKGAKYIMHTNPISLALLAAPSECGADFATGEGQPLGLPLSFGGPYLGYIAARDGYLRKLTGRIVGRTVDKDGRCAYVLTLQAREQHIRREKAASSICSNQALCALTASVYLSAVGKDGLVKVAEACVKNAHYLARVLETAGLGRKYEKTEFFHEFVTKDTSVSGYSSRILNRLKRFGILGGLKLSEREILWCATELNTVEEIELVGKIVEECGGKRV